MELAQVSGPKAAKDSAPVADKPSAPAKTDSFKKHQYEFFKDDIYAREFVFYDPTTGQATFCKTKEEMEERQNELLDRRKADLMLSSAGDPASLIAMQNSIRSQKLQLGLKEEYRSLEEDKAAVLNAARSQAGSMSVAELKLLAHSYPELNAIADERIAQARVRGISPEVIANMKVSEIDELAKQKLAAPKPTIV